MTIRPLPIIPGSLTFQVVGTDGVYATFATTDPGAMIVFSWGGTVHPGSVSGSETGGFLVIVPSDPTAYVVKVMA